MEIRQSVPDALSVRDIGVDGKFEMNAFERLLLRLDRRWIFLAMFLAVAVPLLCGLTFPEKVTPATKVVFDTIEAMPEGSKVVISFDFDPASAGEMAPMAAAFVRHCCEKKLKLYLMTLWYYGPPIMEPSLSIIKNEYPHMKYGIDYVHLGYKAGYQVAIRNAMSDLKNDFHVDHYGTAISQIPMMQGIDSLRDMDLFICPGSGFPGPQEWVQFAAAPYHVKMLIGSPGVQTPTILPYVPQQVIGMIGSVKQAAEYEQALIVKQPALKNRPSATEALRRMGPQFVAHLLMIGLIVLGNVAYLSQRSAGVQR